MDGARADVQRHAGRTDRLRMACQATVNGLACNRCAFVTFRPWDAIRKLNWSENIGSRVNLQTTLSTAN